MKFFALIPLGLPIGTIEGVELFKDSVFSKTSTISCSGLYLKSTSPTGFFVTPSKTTKLGFWLYPFPNDVIPIDLKPLKGEILKTCGNMASGFKVTSVG